MNKEEAANYWKTIEKVTQKLKQEAIKEIGAIDFHFQVPKFDTPLMLIPAILHELAGC